MTGPLQGLNADAQARCARAGAALAAGRVAEADALVRDLAAAYPGHPDVLHLVAALRARRGDHDAALAALRQALQARPDDATLLCALGVQLSATGQLDAALEALQRACRVRPDLAMAWYNLGVLQTRAVQFEAAETALRKALEIAPDNLRARLQLADLQWMAGHADQASATWRAVLATRQWCGAAWWGLSGVEHALGDGDVPAMQAALRDARAGERDRVALGFAIARVLDRNRHCTEALAVLQESHAHARRLQPWDAGAFTRGVDAVLAAFAVMPPPPTAQLGHGVIFIVGLPRSGSTLTEQVLAANPQVEASGELRDLPQVLAEESRRRGCAYPEWVAALDAGDWQRLGERYLGRTARWRRHKPFCTDKLPGNWMHVGAIHAMLPGAKVIVCRRDPVETCFACYCQLMTADGQGWTHRFEDVGKYWNDFDRAVRAWRERFPALLHEQRYEDLLADREGNVRTLLAFCGLPFDVACLDFDHRAGVVRSPSAAQVRGPLRHDTARAPRYGTLLDRLRTALGFVDIMSAH